MQYLKVKSRICQDCGSMAQLVYGGVTNKRGDNLIAPRMIVKSCNCPDVNPIISREKISEVMNRPY